MTAGRVDQAGLGDALRNHDSRLRDLEQQVGRWVYVLPIPPATPPDNWMAGDPLAPSVQNGWSNVAGEQPLSFRLHPATKVQIRGAIFGGTIPSVVFTLPVNYRPTQGPAPIIFPGAGTSSFTGRVDTNGDVWVLAENAPVTDAIRFNVDNEGGFLDITTNEVDPLGAGMQLIDNSGGGIYITNEAFGPISIGGDATDTVAIRAISTLTIEAADIELEGDTVAVRLVTAGDTFTVYDHSANPIFRLTG